MRLPLISITPLPGEEPTEPTLASALVYNEPVDDRRPVAVTPEFFVEWQVPQAS